MANVVEMPKLGFDMAEGTLVNWLKPEGEKINKGEALVEIETDKATIQVESPFSGIIFKQLAQVNDHIPVGMPIAVIATEGENVNLDDLLAKKVLPSAQSAQNKDQVQSILPLEVANPSVEDVNKTHMNASPLAKAMAEQFSIDLASVKGSGPHGRVVKRDIEVFIKQKGKSIPIPTNTGQTIPQDQKFEINRLRAAVGNRMTESKKTIPHFYITNDVNVKAMLEMRKEMNVKASAEERISVNDFIVRATALALRQMPALNSSLTDRQIIQYGHIHIGIAVALDEGLLTVVCRNADQKSPSAIAKEVKEMTSRVREGKVKAEDIEGSTFTISNLGMFDVENFAAIINPPESGILAVASAREVPVIENGTVTIGQRMKITLSADHRVTDGASAARFMQILALFIEQPWRLV